MRSPARMLEIATLGRARCHSRAWVLTCGDSLGIWASHRMRRRSRSRSYALRSRS